MRSRLVAVMRGFQKNRCYLCGERMLNRKGGHKSEKHWFATIDHIYPRSRGGPNRVGNCALAHERCNEEKDGRMPRPCEVFFGAAVRSIVLREDILWRRKHGERM